MSTPAPHQSIELVSLRERMAEMQASGRRWSWGRLASFLAFAVCAGLASETPAWAIACPLGLIAFGFCFLKHHAALDGAHALERQATLLEESLSRRASRRRAYRPSPPGGATALEQGRLVGRDEPPAWEVDTQTAEDLDACGQATVDMSGAVLPTRTLLGFLDATSTVFGQRRLRYLLLHPPERPATIRERQEVSRNLAERDALRQGVLDALLPLRQHRLETLEARLDEPHRFDRPLLTASMAHLLGSLPLAALALAWPFGESVAALAGLLVLVNIAVVLRHSRRTRPALERLFALEGFLQGLQRLRAALEREPIDATAWRAATGTLDAVRPAAAALEACLKRLAVSRLGLLGELVQWLTLWELRWLPAAERTLARSREDLRRAAGALGEIEAAICLALPLREQQDFDLPTVLEGPLPELEAAELGHPLLDPGTAVRNPLRLGPEHNAWVITGSNMAGKSTYLRAVGLNYLLAAAGGPVCAHGFRFTPMALLSDINVRDSLDDGKSYFRAEVERVRRIIDRAGEHPATLALIDEIFRGTNSLERSALSRAILAHLAESGALCLVATHDLTLAEFAATRVPRATNKHFRETVEDGALSFDFRLRDGPTTTRNALRVLELGGYPRAILDEARRLAGE